MVALRGGERLRCPVLARATAIETGTERGENVDHVLHEIVLHFGLVDVNVHGAQSARVEVTSGS
jgi:predicted Zn-dependent protease with MMP-like domain